MSKMTVAELAANIDKRLKLVVEELERINFNVSHVETTSFNFLYTQHEQLKKILSKLGIE